MNPPHGKDVARLESFSVSDFIKFSTITGLDMIPVQRMARYRQIHWPFYHQFTVVTTVRILPSVLKPEMFSLQTTEGRNVLLDDLDPAVNGISFRIDRTSKVELEIEDSELVYQANFDRVEILLPGTKPLGGPEARDFELTWCLTRKPGIEPTQFSLCVGDISLFASWVSKLNKHYDLLRNNCWILSTSMSLLTLYHYFQYEFDLASRMELAASRTGGSIRWTVSKFFSGPNRFLNWVVEEEQYRLLGSDESARSRTEIPFLRHPDRAGFGLLLSTCATSSKSPAGFANQPDDVLLLICFRFQLLISDWKTQIEEDPTLKDDFQRFIHEVSSIPSHRRLETLRPDIRRAYTTAMTLVYKNPGLRSNFVGQQVVACIPQYLNYLEGGNHSNDWDLKSFVLFITYSLPFQDELQELIQMDILSVWVRIFHHHHHLTPQSHANFETLLLRFCSQNPTSRQYFLKSNALLYVREMLMRKPQSPFLLTALSFVKKSESVAVLHNRLISCGVLVPLARCLALTDYHNMTIMIENNKGEHLLERSILSYLAQSFNHPFFHISFDICGIIFSCLCALGDDAKKDVVNAGALPGICRLAHPDSHDTNSQGSQHLPYENLLGAIAGIDATCAAKVAKARKRYYRGFKVQTLDAPKPTIWGRLQAMVTPSKT
ncbi:hypothetical protein BS47DRAFT_1341786 [Hydnum rufescens UP504]|uniref:Uncharacterized protein n=1 Tax=Hydnum rufescens UP504 TaxID=1448309 RepID=A0A9P6DZ49_9AGAM|nr:hypothetical protein BS47DRAFT_1341786 [Hydnum rufescens UP504]